jgi:arginyl-tRNA synthetase
MQDIYSLIRIYISSIVFELYSINIDNHSIVIETPKNIEWGDFSVNISFQLAKLLNLKPHDISITIQQKLMEKQYIENVSVAGSGFINFFVSDSFWREWMKNLLTTKDLYISPIGVGKRVLVEFVSANPTGPLHLGHARGSVYGDVMCGILKATGHNVIKDYYINDAGVQIDTLLASTMVRYRNLFGADERIEEGMYPGEYLIDVAKELQNKYGDKLMLESVDTEEVKQFVVDSIMEVIKVDLAKIGIYHDQYTSEYHELHVNQNIQKAIEFLDSKQLIYKGVLPKPKGVEIDDWEPKEQLIFRSTLFGDDVDRVLQKSDGSYTYFAADLGLAYTRVNRGYNDVYIIVGADHIGYVKRMQAIYKSLSSEWNLTLPVMQMVTLMEGGAPLKMSKRAGTFVTLSDLYDSVGKNPIRFIMLMRKPDTKIDFDLKKALEMNSENPIFYVNYAYARACSVLRIAKEELGAQPDSNYLEKLVEREEFVLVKKLAQLGRVVEQSATHQEPHRIVNYVMELAHEFHGFWSMGRDNKSLKFIIHDDVPLTSARLSLVLAFKLTLGRAFEILGITPQEQM